MTRRRGFSLTELLVALGIFSVLMVTALGFYREQGEAFTEGNERAALMQNLRYGINALEQSLRTAGIGVTPDQPILVYAGERVVSFNADYATPLENDFFAVYHDPHLPTGAASAPTPARRFTIPGTSFSYPDAEYRTGTGNSPAETITFFFAPDSTSVRTDDFVLLRQVNDLEPEVIARNLVETDTPFFTFQRTSTSATSPIEAIPTSALPLRHSAPAHGAPSDTGPAARIDEIRAVSVSYAAVGDVEGRRDTRREIRRLIRLPNAGMATPRICGDAPQLGTALSATGVDRTASSEGYVRLEWNAAIDELGGEHDVLRYVLWRMESAGAEPGDPLVSLAAGSSSYLYQDRTAEPDTDYWYALAAQDCTPAYSAPSRSGRARWSS